MRYLSRWGHMGIYVDYQFDIGSLHVLDYRLYLALRDWPWRGRKQSSEAIESTKAQEAWHYV